MVPVRIVGSALERIACMLLLFSMFGNAAAQSSWNPTLLVNTEAFQVIDDTDNSSDLELRFGSELNARIVFDRINDRFVFTKPVLIQGALTLTGSLQLTRSNLSGTLLYMSGTTVMRTLKPLSGQILVGQGTDGPEWKSPVTSLVWYIGGDISTGQSQGAIVTMPFGMTASSVSLRVKGAPTGAALILNLNKNGTTIFATRPQVNDGSFTGGGSAAFTVTNLEQGSVLTLDVDQIGSTFAGSGLTLMLNGIRSY